MLLQFLRDRFEEEFFSTVSDTISSMLVMATVQILSAHASDEEYLDKSEHKYIKVRLLHSSASLCHSLRDTQIVSKRSAAKPDQQNAHYIQA